MCLWLPPPRRKTEATAGNDIVDDSVDSFRCLLVGMLLPTFVSLVGEPSGEQGPGDMLKSASPR